MKELPLITVIVPAYNVEKTIERCINSITKQTYNNLEIIIVNDGSTDNTQAVCENVAKNDTRINVINKENEKVSKTRNRGIEEATGDYIVFVDSDDYIQNDMIIKLLKNIEECDLCTCNYYINFDNGKTIVKTQLKDFEEDKSKLNLYLENMYKDMLFNVIWNKIYKTEIIKKYNILFEEDLQVGEDYLFNIKYIEHINNAKYISEPLYYYTVQANSLSRKFINRKVSSEIKITRELKKFYQNNNYNMWYVYNEYVNLIKINLSNLMIGKKNKQEIYEFINEFINEMKKDKITDERIGKELKGENRIIFKFLMNKKISIFYNYFRFRNQIKEKLIKLKR